MLRSYWKTLVYVLVVLAVIWYLLNVQYGSLPAFPSSFVDRLCRMLSHGCFQWQAMSVETEVSYVVDTPISLLVFGLLWAGYAQWNGRTIASCSPGYVSHQASWWCVSRRMLAHGCHHGPAV